MKINGIGHAAYNVQDMDKSLAYYCGILGFEELFHLENDKGEPWIVYLKLCEGQYIELFYKTDDAQSVNPSYNHLCIDVPDIFEVEAYLKEKGVLTSPVKMGKCGNYQCWTADPDGNRIEMMQMMPNCLHLTAGKRYDH